MKKKVLLILLSLVCAVAFALGLSACGNTQDTDPPKDPVSFTVTFETNGGTPIDSITVDGSKRLKTVLDGKTTEKQDMVFDGWYDDASFNNQVNLDAYIDGDIKLYAKWRDYTDAEILENAVKNTRKYAVAAHDSGRVRLNVTNSGYANADVTLSLDNGVITAGSHGDKYYKDQAFYYTSNNENIKLKQKEAETVTEFLYLNVIGTVDYKQHGFYSTFAPLSMFRLADEQSLCSFERNDDVFTVTYKGSNSGVGHNWKEENNPWVYFDAGKIFKFTVSDKRVVKVEQMLSTKANRTIEFFYENDENIPSVAQPQNESSYTQKWQVKANGAILLVTELNKAQLDERAYSGCTQITKNQTWYYDKEMQNAVNFDENGIAEITQHYDLYHPAVDYDAIVLDEFIITLSKYNTELELVGTSTENGIKITTFKRTDAQTSGDFDIKVEPGPWRAKNLEFTAELVDIQNDGLLTVESYVGSKSVTLSKSITGEYRIKLTAAVGGYVEYICIQPLN
ncbi:MAG: InlB B-repeat-containing protein [Clostridia bacterium]|nr:InlB B-repeat-containing protein [Clostridia bacterium]